MVEAVYLRDLVDGDSESYEVLNRNAPGIGALSMDGYAFSGRVLGGDR